MNKKIIVTGVTGMDGSNMVDYLLKNTDHEIYGIIRRTSKPDFSNLNNSINNPRFKLLLADLSDGQSIDKIVSELIPDYFINFAAQSFVGSSWKIPEQTFDVCAVGVIRCLEAIRKYAPNCRFYNAGSSEQFGKVEYSPQDEKHPFRPQSPYGAAKCASQHIVRVYRESYNIYAVQGLLFNHEGPRRGEEFVTRKITKGVGRIVRAIRNNERYEPIFLGNINAKRDWSDSRDFIDGVWRMLNQEHYNPYFPSGNFMLREAVHKKIVQNIKEYVLSSNETHTVKEFIELAFKRAGIDGFWQGEGLQEEFLLSTNSTPLVKISPEFFRPAEVDLLLGDSTLARKELGWKPRYSFQDLVNDMVDTDL